MRYFKGDFSTGEISPNIFGKPESPVYIAGCKTLHNMLPLPTGGACNRPGTRYVAQVKSGGTKWRLVSFIFSSGDAYVLEFGNLYVRLFKAGAPVLSGGSPYEVVTPWGSSDLASLKFAQSADTLFIVHPNYQPRTLSRTADTSWALATYDYIDGPYMLENADNTITITPSAATGSVTLTAPGGKNIFSNITGYTHSAGRTLFKISHWISAQSTSKTFNGSGGTGTAIKCGGTWRIVTHGSDWVGTVTIEVSEDNSTWTTSRVYSGKADKNWDTYTTETFAKQFYVRTNVTALTAGTLQVDLSSDPFEWNGVAQITAVPAGGGGSSQMYNTATATVISTLGGTTATKTWAEGSWSAYRGYPSCVAFYQDRLCFAGTRTEADTVHMSKSGNYYNFGTSFPLKDDDGISVRMPSQQYNRITNLVQLNCLLAMTSAGVFSIRPGGGGALTPTSIDIKANDLAGAAALTPAVINDRLVYAQTKGKIIRDSGYNYETDGFNGINLTFNADHIFRDYAATEMAYQAEPLQTLWIIREDGRLASLTYLKQAEVYGWATHSTHGGFINPPTDWYTYGALESSGVFLSICTVPGSDQDDLYAIVERTNQSGTKVRTVERFVNRFTTKDPAHQVFLDCSFEFDTPIEVSGIERVYDTDHYVNKVTTSTAHGMIDDDEVEITGVKGAPSAYINGIRFTVKKVDNTSFYLYLDGEPYDDNPAGDVSVPVDVYARKIFTTASGLSALYNMRCAILTNGIGDIDNENYTPDVSGNVSLGAPSYGTTILQIGLRYYSILETVPINLETNLGNTQTNKQSISDAVVSLFETYGGHIRAGYYDEVLEGSVYEDLKEMTDDNGNKMHHSFTAYQPTGVPPALFTGAFKQTMGTESKKPLTIEIRQEMPYPITIQAISAEVGG